MDKPVIIIGNLKFSDLCLILDFAYLGQSQVPSDKLDDFLRAGEMLQIRGIKEGRIQYLNSVQQPTTINRSFDSTISSTQEHISINEPPVKRAHEDDEISIQEASEIMKMLLDGNNDMEVDNKAIPTQVKTTAAPLSGKPNSFFMAKAPIVTRASPFAHQLKGGKKISEKPKFLCRFCSRALTTQGRIKKHENECADNPNRQIAICDVCNVQLKPSSLSLHKNTKHKQSQSFPAPSTSNDSSSVVSEKISELPIINPLLIQASRTDSTETVETEVKSLFGNPMQVDEQGSNCGDVSPKPLIIKLSDDNLTDNESPGKDIEEASLNEEASA